MLMALLYQDQDQLIAAALACDYYALGNRYWQEVSNQGISYQPDMEIAVVQIEDQELAERLLAMDFTDANEAAHAVDAYLGLTV